MALFNTDRLNRSERKQLRDLRKKTKGMGFGRRGVTGLKSEDANTKRRLEQKRRKARGEDFGKGVIAAAAGGLGAAFGGGAAAGKLAGEAGSKLAGKVAGKVASKAGSEAGKKALLEAGKKQLKDFTKKAIASKLSGATSSVNTDQLPQANPRATENSKVANLMNKLKGMDGALSLEDIPLEEESFDDPSSLEMSLDNPSFAEFGSAGIDQFPTRPPRGMGMEAILADINRKNTLSGLEDIPLSEESFPEDETFGQMEGLSREDIGNLAPSSSNINKLTRLMQQKRDQGRSELDAVGELDNVTTFGTTTEADDSLARMIARGTGKSFLNSRGAMPMIGSEGALGQLRKLMGDRGLAGLGNTFKIGGRMKVVKKKY